jgi:GDP-L-fucose synthase
MASIPKRRVFVAGHRGMVGANLVTQLQADTSVELVVRTRSELDLCDQAAVAAFFAAAGVDEVYLAAAKVGGIHANDTYPADFIYQNLMMECNVVHQAWAAGVKRLLFLGSSCIYPRLADQPMAEASLLTGTLEPTNEPYAVAKIAGIKLCESYNRQYGTDYRAVMPTNLYGPGDNFHPVNSHVIPAMMRRFHQAKLGRAQQVMVWGSGAPKREFLHVADMARACVHVMNLPADVLASQTAPTLSHLNVGTGQDCSINELAHCMARVVGFDGALVFDSSKPDGAPRKLLDVTRLSRLGWTANVGLEEGLQSTYQWYLAHVHNLRAA